jgi:hypothetical protein
MLPYHVVLANLLASGVPANKSCLINIAQDTKHYRWPVQTEMFCF